MLLLWAPWVCLLWAPLVLFRQLDDAFPSPQHLLALLLALGKGRSTHAPLSFICRQHLALSLFGNCSCRVRWIASEHNPSDWLSRLKGKAVNLTTFDPRDAPSRWSSSSRDASAEQLQKEVQRLAFYGPASSGDKILGLGDTLASEPAFPAFIIETA